MIRFSNLFLLIGIVAVAGIGCFSSQPEPFELVSESIIYTVDGVEYEGYAAYSKYAKSPLPGVLVYHQWMGQTDYEKRRVRELAELGYIAYAADIYGKDVRPANAKEASSEAGKYYKDRQLFRERATIAYNQLKMHPKADSTKLAAIGYCFGGTTVLELARSGAKLNGIVSFHGGLANPNPDDAKQIGCPVLVLHGADDPYVPAKDVEAFYKEMNDADADYVFVSFANAVHAFTQPMAGDDPSKGVAYNEKADRRSWDYMKDFFEEIFQD